MTGTWRGSATGLEIDFHGFTVYEAREAAVLAVEAAWQRGHETISLSHGAGYAPSSGFYHGTRGGIKRSLYSMWNHGEFMQWAYNRRSAKHSTTPTRIMLALRPNPSPISDPLPDLGIGFHAEQVR